MKKFDIETCKKLLSSYAEKVNLYMKENENLKTELKDIKTSLEINKEILFKQLNVNILEENKNYLKILKEENERLTKNNSILYKEKNELERKLYTIQQQLEQVLTKKQKKEENFYFIKSIKRKGKYNISIKKRIN